MKAQIVEQIELFSEVELESLEFVPEELEAIEQERVPDLDSLSFEDIAEDLEAILKTDVISDREYIRLGNMIMALKSRYDMVPLGDVRRHAWRQEMQKLAELRQVIVRRYEREAEEARRRQEDLQRLFGHLRPPEPQPPFQRLRRMQSLPSLRLPLQPRQPRPLRRQPSMPQLRPLTPPPRPPAPGPQSRQNQSRSLTRSLSGLGSRRSGGASS